MSSVVNKSGTRFVPKFAKRQSKKPLSTESKVDSSAVASLITPPSTQITTERPLFDESIDPADASKPLKSVFEDSDEDNNSDDITNEQLKASNKDFTRSRRLSSIAAPNSIKNRAGSISYVPPSDDIPTRIGVPLTRPPKRRKSSTVKLNDMKRNKSSSAAITLAVSSTPSQIATPQPDLSTERETENNDSLKLDSDDVTRLRIGIDPQTKKFRRFEDHEVIGPEVELTTVITSLRNISRRTGEDLYAQLSISDEISMAELCSASLPIGEVSDKFDLVQEAAKKIRQRKLRRKELRERARKEKKSIEAFEEEMEATRFAELERKKAQEALMNTKEEVQQTSFKLTVTDGKINIDEESLVVDRHVRDNTNDFREKVDENPYENPVNSASFGKKKYTDRWTSEETGKFYRALSTWGTDFAVIAELFPYRNRRQIKLKFNLEERRHPHIIEIALRRKLPVDFEGYCKESVKEFKTLDEYNQELDDIKREHQEALKTMSAEKEKAKQEDAEAQRRREIEIRTGTKTMTRAEKLRMLRQNETVVGTIDDVKRQREEEIPVS